MTAGRRTESLGELYARHAPAAGRLAYLLTGDRDLAEDIAQEAFLRVIARFGSLRSPESFRPYLQRTVVNLARGHFRRRRTEREYVSGEGSRRARDVATIPDVEERDTITRALEGLSARQRAAIVLRYYEDLSERQTADLLGCPVGTVKSLVARGTERLREELGGVRG
jgi:RNA polymerase sigma-70 factor (sigma-E family)